MFWLKTTTRVIFSLIVIIALCVGGWFLYWKITQANVNQQYQVNTHSQQYQSAQIDEARDYFNGWSSDEQALITAPASQKSQWTSQAQDEANTFCATYADLTKPPSDLIEDATKVGCTTTNP